LQYVIKSIKLLCNKHTYILQRLQVVEQVNIPLVCLLQPALLLVVFIMKETRKEIPWYEEKYEVSNTWKVRSKWFYVNLWHYIQKRKWKELSLKKRYWWYCMVNLKHPNKWERVHRLVALSFLENKEWYKYINHIDGDWSNNNVGNLEWCTHKHNMEHARNILWKWENMNSWLKEWQKHLTQKKKVYQYDLLWNFIKEWDYLAQIKKETGICNKTISYKILHRDWIYLWYKRLYQKAVEATKTRQTLSEQLEKAKTTEVKARGDCIENKQCTDN